jgi:hypothetical protein
VRMSKHLWDNNLVVLLRQEMNLSLFSILPDLILKVVRKVEFQQVLSCSQKK